tara:strand:+ start:5245 stop:6162 length:918 start_codon:yes stop_codon:yes gene_type:complete
MMTLASCIAHTKASLSYGWNDEKNAELVFKNLLIGRTVNEISQEFKMIQESNDNCTLNTISVVLSLSTNNQINVGKEEWAKLIKEYLEGMGLSGHQAIAFQHKDKPHAHCHLYINRIGFDGRAYRDSNIGSKSGEIADKISEKYGLHRPKQIKKERLEKTERIRGEIFKFHNYTLKVLKNRTYEGYINQMKKHDVDIKPVLSRKGHINGFRYHYKNHSIKASEVHRSMSFKNLHKALYSDVSEKIDLSETRSQFQEIYNSSPNQNNSIIIFDLILEAVRNSQYQMQDSLFQKNKKKKKGRRGSQI